MKLEGSLLTVLLLSLLLPSSARDASAVPSSARYAFEVAGVNSNVDPVAVGNNSIDDGADNKVRILPDKQTTGVEPAMIRLCITISVQMYLFKSFTDFKLSTKDTQTDLFIYDNHGDFQHGSPPFLVAITGKTMILSWRGSVTLFDWLNDLSGSPVSSLVWKKYAKTIKAQGSMISIVENDISRHEKSIIKKVKELGITEIITTGHALGGGLAQVSHLTIRAQIEDKSSPWYELFNKGINVRSVTFCAPMTICLPQGNASPKADKFIENLQNNSCNLIYANDIVPRCYAYQSFLQGAIDELSGDVAAMLCQRYKIPGLLRNLVGLEGMIKQNVDTVIKHDRAKALMAAMRQYRHIGKLVYYPSKNEGPMILKDTGCPPKNFTFEKNDFRRIQYKPQKKKTENGGNQNMFRKVCNVFSNKVKQKPEKIALNELIDSHMFFSSWIYPMDDLLP